MLEEEFARGLAKALGAKINDKLAPLLDRIAKLEGKEQPPIFDAEEFAAALIEADDA